MNLSNFIARRYLFAKKSMGVINIISVISALGIALGCAALVIILSIYNGFDSLVRELNSSYTPDLVIEPLEGKTLDMGDSLLADASEIDGIRAFCPVVEENVFIQHEGKHIVATARGVDSLYESVTALKDYVVDGSFELMYGQVNQVVLGRTIAMRLGARPAFLSPIEVYFPSRNKDVDMLDPLSSLRKEEVFLSGIVSLEQEFDQKYIFMPLESLRSLLEYDSQATRVEVYLHPSALDRRGMASQAVQKRFHSLLDGRYSVKDRQQQNRMLYKLLRYEKMAIYLILLFVIIIISFNIFSSLSMLIIEKKKDVEILRSMGADEKLIRDIFVKEGWLISILGIVLGTIIALVLCFLQQRYGFVKMPGNFVVNAYPVVVQWTDVLLVIAGVGIIGYLISALTKSQKL